MDGVRISDFSKTTTLGNWSACPMPLGFDDGTATDATLSGLAGCAWDHTPRVARGAVAGLSDPILSGCSPAENVQTPFRARRPANRQTGGPMPLGFDPPHPGGMGRQ